MATIIGGLPLISDSSTALIWGGCLFFYEFSVQEHISRRC
jgi:hypothetical protein